MSNYSQDFESSVSSSEEVFFDIGGEVPEERVREVTSTSEDKNKNVASRQSEGKNPCTKEHLDNQEYKKLKKETFDVKEKLGLVGKGLIEKKERANSRREQHMAELKECKNQVHSLSSSIKQNEKYFLQERKTYQLKISQLESKLQEKLRTEFHSVHFDNTIQAEVKNLKNRINEIENISSDKDQLLKSLRNKLSQMTSDHHDTVARIQNGNQKEVMDLHEKLNQAQTELINKVQTTRSNCLAEIHLRERKILSREEDLARRLREVDAKEEGLAFLKRKIVFQGKQNIEDQQRKVQHRIQELEDKKEKHEHALRDLHLERKLGREKVDNELLNLKQKIDALEEERTSVHRTRIEYERCMMKLGGSEQLALEERKQLDHKIASLQENINGLQRVVQSLKASSKESKIKEDQLKQELVNSRTVISDQRNLIAMLQKRDKLDAPEFKQGEERTQSGEEQEAYRNLVVKERELERFEYKLQKKEKKLLKYEASMHQKRKSFKQLLKSLTSMMEPKQNSYLPELSEISNISYPDHLNNYWFKLQNLTDSMYN
eukprot:snap_masked-scaffold_5-processed-gene-13.60-mRNA-1 protein AED:1.00 eAED:1.00 QI:0/-1/0/0/-1/1/1/0/546